MDGNEQMKAEADRRRKLQSAYISLFGEIGKPTPIGALVLDDLERFTGHRIESLAISPVSKTVDIHATIYRTGKQAVMKRIYERITWKEISDGNGNGHSDAAGAPGDKPAGDSA